MLEGFVNDLDVAMVNLHDSVQLHPCTVDLEAYKKPTDYVNAAHNPEIINSLESKYIANRNSFSVLPSFNLFLFLHFQLLLTNGASRLSKSLLSQSK